METNNMGKPWLNLFLMAASKKTKNVSSLRIK